MTRSDLARQFDNPATRLRDTAATSRDWPSPTKLSGLDISPRERSAAQKSNYCLLMCQADAILIRTLDEIEDWHIIASHVSTLPLLGSSATKEHLRIRAEQRALNAEYHRRTMAACDAHDRAEEAAALKAGL